MAQRQHDSQMSILSLHTLAVPPPGPQAVSQASDAYAHLSPSSRPPTHRFPFLSLSAASFLPLSSGLPTTAPLPAAAAAYGMLVAR